MLMRISDDVCMAVEAGAYLAALGCGAFCAAPRLAAWINRSAGYTEILMDRLCAAGLVEVHDEERRFYALGRPAHQITIVDVFDVFGEPDGLRERSLNACSFEPAPAENLHGADLLWEALRNRILLFLDGVTLADIISDNIPRLEKVEADIRSTDFLDPLYAYSAMAASRIPASPSADRRHSTWNPHEKKGKQ